MIDPLSPTPVPLGRRDFLHALLWFLFGLVVYGTGIGSRDLWDPDEPRYAEVAREMRADGHWIVPHVNGRVYGHKPPLFFWTIAGLSYVTGEVDSWTARAPSVAAGALLLAFTCLFGTRRFGRRAGGLATAVLATNYLFVSLATHANIDQLHAVWTTAALFLWFEATSGDHPRHALRAVAWGLAGLALLTKGVGVLLILLVAVAGMLAGDRPRKVRDGVWIGAGVAIALAVAACWYIPALIIGGSEYGKEIGLRQTVTRATQPWSHERPWYYFFVNFPPDVLPWALFLPATLLATVDGWKGPQARAIRYLALWCAVIFVFFSLSASKRHIYLLPLCPAWALLTGVALAGATRSGAGGGSWPSFAAGAEAVRRAVARVGGGRNGDPGEKGPLSPLASDAPGDSARSGAFARATTALGRALSIALSFSPRAAAATTAAVVGLLGLAAISGPWWAESVLSRVIEAQDVSAAAASLIQPGAWLGPVLLAAALVMAWAARSRGPVPFAAAVAALTAVILPFAQTILLPRLDSVRSARPFCAMLARLVPADAEVASYGFFEEEVVFYSGRYFHELVFEPANDDEKRRKHELQFELLRRFLDRDGAGHVILREKDWNRVRQAGARVEELARGRMGGNLVIVARETP